VHEGLVESAEAHALEAPWRVSHGGDEARVVPELFEREPHHEWSEAHRRRVSRLRSQHGHAHAPRRARRRGPDAHCGERVDPEAKARVIMGRSLGSQCVADAAYFSDRVADGWIFASASSGMAALIRRRRLTVPERFAEEDLVRFDPLRKVARAGADPGDSRGQRPARSANRSRVAGARCVPSAARSRGSRARCTTTATRFRRFGPRWAR
jgi:hypothetical protein